MEGKGGKGTLAVVQGPEHELFVVGFDEDVLADAGEALSEGEEGGREERREGGVSKWDDEEEKHKARHRRQPAAIPPPHHAHLWPESVARRGPLSGRREGGGGEEREGIRGEVGLRTATDLTFTAWAKTLRCLWLMTTSSMAG